MHRQYLRFNSADDVTEIYGSFFIGFLEDAVDMLQFFVGHRDDMGLSLWVELWLAVVIGLVKGLLGRYAWSILHSMEPWNVPLLKALD